MKRVPRCPKCRSKSLDFNELWRGHTISFSQDSDGMIDPIGFLEPGNPYAVIAYCRCGHSWQLRGVSQIIEVPGHPHYEGGMQKEGGG